MQILDIPQSGKRGLTVSQPGQFGQVSRALTLPANPRTSSQVNVRALLGRVAARWRTLQETQRVTWITAAKEARSNTRLGQRGPLSGFLLFTRINCNLLLFGQSQMDTPPPRPQFPALAPRNLLINNTGGLVTLALTCPADPGQNTIVRGAAPLSQGRETWDDFRILGTCPPPAQGAADIMPASIPTATASPPSAGRFTSASTSSLTAGKTSPSPSGPSSPPQPDLPPGRAGRSPKA